MSPTKIDNHFYKYFLFGIESFKGAQRVNLWNNRQLLLIQFIQNDITIFHQKYEVSRMSSKDKEKWDHKYETPEYVTGKEPVEWLKDHSEYASMEKATALDIASGEGRNAVFAAEKGYGTLAVDISTNGLEKAHALADEKGVTIETCVVDLDSWKIEQNAFDLILCFNFLDRQIFPAIKNALKLGRVDLLRNIHHRLPQI